MSAQRIAARYAKSLIDLAKDGQKLDQIKDDVLGLKSAIDNRDFYLLLKSPIVPTAKKSAIVDQIFDGKVDNLTLEFMRIILRKGRESFLPEITESFLNQYRDLKQITRVSLTTATELSEQALNDIKAKLKEAGVVGEHLEVEHHIDESIIGGFVARIGDKLIDASVAYKMKEMSQSLLN